VQALKSDVCNGERNRVRSRTPSRAGPKRCFRSYQHDRSFFSSMPRSTFCEGALILVLAPNVSDIAVLLIAVLDEDRTVEVFVGEFVIVFSLG
jgi:hypothetical protein